MRRTSKEYIEGYHAAYKGVSKATNPYCYYIEYESHEEWLDGYFAGFCDNKMGLELDHDNI